MGAHGASGGGCTTNQDCACDAPFCSKHKFCRKTAEYGSNGQGGGGGGGAAGCGGGGGGVVPAANCVTGVEILVTQTCVPTAEDVCNTQVVDTEEIEYEKVCKEVVDTLCDAPAAPVAHAAYHYGKREADADAEADPQFFGGYAAHPAVAPVAHAVAHSVQATVKHACREVTTEHCVDNPKIKLVPVEVEHCHTVTKVTCTPVENEI